MIGTVGIIARVTCREALRTRSFLILLGIYAVAVMLSRVVGWIAATGSHAVTTDLVFSLQSLIGVLVAVATGTALVQNEIKQRTLYTVLSRPLHRWQFVVGKFAGLAGALLVGQLAMLGLGLGYLAATGAPVSWALVWAGLLTAEEVIVMAAVSLTWTALSSPLLAAVLSLATYLMGHAVHELPGFLHYLGLWQQKVVMAAASLIPDLGMFGYRNRAVYGDPLLAADYQAVPYGLLWIALLVVITAAIVERKQL